MPVVLVRVDRQAWIMIVESGSCLWLEIFGNLLCFIDYKLGEVAHCGISRHKTEVIRSYYAAPDFKLEYIFDWFHFWQKLLVDYKECLSCEALQKDANFHAPPGTQQATLPRVFLFLINKIVFAFLFHPADSRWVVHLRTQKKVSTHQDLYFKASHCNKFGSLHTGIQEIWITALSLTEWPWKVTYFFLTGFENEEFSWSLPDKIIYDSTRMLWAPHLNKLKTTNH